MPWPASRRCLSNEENALEGQVMSEAAKALTHYANNYRQPCADDSDRDFCRAAALAWAAAIIAGTE